MKTLPQKYSMKSANIPNPFNLCFPIVRQKTKRKQVVFRTFGKEYQVCFHTYYLYEIKELEVKI